MGWSQGGSSVIDPSIHPSIKYNRKNSEKGRSIYHGKRRKDLKRRGYLLPSLTSTYMHFLLPSPPLSLSPCSHYWFGRSGDLGGWVGGGQMMGICLYLYLFALDDIPMHALLLHAHGMARFGTFSQPLSMGR